MEESSDHPHLNPYTKNAGDYHVQGFVNRRTNEFVVRVLDRYEQPEWVVAPSIKGEIKHSDGQVEKVWIDAADYADSPWDERATVTPTYRKWFDWIKKPHDVAFRVWVPLPDRKTYELTFNSIFDQPVPSHSGLF